MSCWFQQLFIYLFSDSFFTIIHNCYTPGHFTEPEEQDFPARISGFAIKAKPRNRLRGLYFSQFVVSTIEQHYMPRIRDQVLKD